MDDVFIGIGSNINPVSSIKEAIRLLEKEVTVVDVSTFYRTPPLGNLSLPYFINGVCKIRTDAEPAALKYEILKKTESLLGRFRTADRYDSRPIDLDLLLYGQLVLHQEGLIIPDPDILERNFIALPLLELSPSLIYPGTGQKLALLVQHMNGNNMSPEPGLTAHFRKRRHPAKDPHRKENPVS